MPAIPFTCASASKPSARRADLDQMLGLLDRAVALLDAHDMPIAAAKIDEVRWEVQRSTGKVACLVRP